MDKYQKIKDLGLEVYDISKTWIPQSFVKADDLLKVLDSGVEVYGSQFSYSTIQNASGDKYSALLINIKELKPKQVTITREDLYDALRSVRRSDTNTWSDLDLAKELGL